MFVSPCDNVFSLKVTTELFTPLLYIQTFSLSLSLLFRVLSDSKQCDEDYAFELTVCSFVNCVEERPST